jgi:ABC-2 type transport system permease protein
MKLSPRRLRAISRKEWIQIRRDSRSMYMAFGLPVLLLIFFGFAISWDVEDLGLAVLDQDGSRSSRELVEAFQSSGYFSVEEYLDSERQIRPALVQGRVRGVVVIPSGFGSRLVSGRNSPIQFMLDGADANTATIAQNYVDAIVAGFSSRATGGAGLDPRAPPIRAESRVWYNPTLESKNMIVPALIAVIMSIIAAMLTALTIAREWERGTMEQLASTPVHRLEVVLGKLIPYVLIGMVDVAVTIVAGLLIFQAPLRGSVLLLAVLTLLFLAGALGLGLFISAAVRSQVLATQIALVATYLPAVLLSGFLFDIGGMPTVLRGVTYLVPARYFVTVTRGIFLKGVGLEALWPQALAMVVFAAVGLGLAALVFRKEVAR